MNTSTDNLPIPLALLKDELLEVRFIYSEPERQLLRIRVNRFPFDFDTY